MAAYDWVGIVVRINTEDKRETEGLLLLSDNRHDLEAE
jgi:hypothetical protein